MTQPDLIDADYVLVQLPFILPAQNWSGSCRCMCGVHAQQFCQGEATTHRAFQKPPSLGGRTVQVPMCQPCAESIDVRISEFTRLMQDLPPQPQ